MTSINQIRSVNKIVFVSSHIGVHWMNGGAGKGEMGPLPTGDLNQMLPDAMSNTTEARSPLDGKKAMSENTELYGKVKHTSLRHR